MRLRNGSTTTSVAALCLRALRISSQVWIDVETGSIPHATTVDASGRFSGSVHGQPVRPDRANHWGPQIERSSWVAPRRLKIASIVPKPLSTPIDPRYE